MQLTKSNYYSKQAQEAYWSASFVKEMLACPARAMARMRGKYEPPASQALLLGSYVDAYFEGTLSQFTQEHKELYTKAGNLKSEFVKAEEMIGRAKSDKLFYSFLSGERQKIFCGEIAGIPFRCKMDFYISGRRIVDLKTVKDMSPVYKPGQGLINFADAWNWPLQMSIYQHLEGNRLPCYLAVITKESPPDLEVVQIPQRVLDDEMEILKTKLPLLDAMRSGVIEPQRCGRCAYCRETKKLSKPVSLDEFEEYGG